MKKLKPVLLPLVLALTASVGCSGPKPVIGEEVASKRAAPPAPFQSTGSCLPSLIEDLKVEWPNNEIINIVAFGHSVPAGYGDTTEVQMLDAYPRQLENALSAKYRRAVLNVINSGVGGNDSQRGLKRIQRDVLDHHPRVVLIDFALNDRGIPLERSRENLIEIVERVRAVGACPVLLTPTWDLTSNFEDPNDPLVKQVAMIRAIAAEQSAPLADSYAAFLQFDGDRRSLMATFNHPNRAGHQLVLGRLLPLFEEK
ncbi:SGNH/GDSL hydrolase family protein [Stenotrophomonas maltophilia]|uniref:SGNH/GDSL hydrolase family protein n=1 Tax=Stenotrophomonas maltophilia TaxID=40324 RepID=UPI0013FD6105|nr:SGNH/GDSL hydrolase family protein [Stenotrophomonas maltophilia]MCO7458390.1 SGNH/GDSL hydrolase family protein [Stenotrophomonas maltophilia]MCO7466398.1 SGNH/GDSL hydrolase family protein [Stenotrophomonas maltophilia]MCO7482546.1 SGNH/GDSL hydrolase family protein [Stenotrophomonas maltophilia]MCO7491671.1 SGNH/GDSL hydrolase family protein [Stenotrophomonas maltophilia]